MLGAAGSRLGIARSFVRHSILAARMITSSPRQEVTQVLIDWNVGDQNARAAAVPTRISNANPEQLKAFHGDREADFAQMRPCPSSLKCARSAWPVVLVNCQLGARGDEGQPGFTLVFVKAVLVHQ